MESMKRLVEAKITTCDASIERWNGRLAELSSVGADELGVFFGILSEMSAEDNRTIIRNEVMMQKRIQIGSVS
jgi:hypothetical protein